MAVQILRIASWITVMAGVALFVSLVPEVQGGGITERVPAEKEYLLALVPLEVASAVLLLLIAIGPTPSASTFSGKRRVAFWLVTVVTVAFWLGFYADWHDGLLGGRLARFLLA
jgi:hypothetical protein